MTTNNTSGKKLIFYISSLSSGGAERVTVNLANSWAAKGWIITIVTLSKQNLDFYELHPSVKRISLEMSGDSANILTGLWQNIRRVVALRRLLRQLEPDIALSMMTNANVVLALAAWGLPNLRTIGTEHIHPPQMPLSYLWETLRKYTYGLLNAMAVLTSETKNWIQEHTKAKKIPVIPNAIVLPLPVHAPWISPELNHQYDKMLLAVGRLENQKGFDWLIEAFSNLAPKHPEWILGILGEGSQRRELESLILDKNLQTRVFLPGRVGNLKEWYENADLYVMSSRFEGFPMTLLEAMAHGVASISFDCDTGPRDIIRHEVDGLLVPSGDVMAMTITLDNIMNNEILRMQLSERAKEVRERFTMEKIIKLWEQLFDEVLKSPIGDQ